MKKYKMKLKDFISLKQVNYAIYCKGIENIQEALQAYEKLKEVELDNLTIGQCKVLVPLILNQSEFFDHDKDIHLGMFVQTMAHRCFNRNTIAILDETMLRHLQEPKLLSDIIDFFDQRADVTMKQLDSLLEAKKVEEVYKVNEIYYQAIKNKLSDFKDLGIKPKKWTKGHREKINDFIKKHKNK